MTIGRITRRRFARVAGATAALIATPRILRADILDRPVRLMVGFAPGGTVDVVARIIAQSIGPFLGQPMVIENRPGASATLAARAVVRAEPDGCTLLYGVFSHAVAPALVRLNYDTLKDLTAVSQTASVPLLMFAATRTPFHSIADVISAANAAPTSVTFASGGVGSSAHLAGELFSRRAGIKLLHVPFRGGAPATQALLAGEVDLLWDTPQPGTRSYIEGAQMRALAVMAPKRLEAYPEIAAISEAGLGGNLEVQAWQGILARSTTPPAVIDRLYRAIANTLAVTEARERIAALAVEPMATTPASFETFFRAEVARWTTVARTAGISTQ